MKPIFQKNAPARWIFAALICTGILSTGTALTKIAAVAEPVKQSQNSDSQITKDRRSYIASAKQSQTNQLPSSVINAIRREIASSATPQGSLRVVTSTQERWPDSCLGLPRNRERCGRVIVNGWRVTMTDGAQTWIYRSDASGRILRLESLQKSDTNLPSSVSNAVLQKVSQESRLPVSALRIVKAERAIWAYGCERPTFPNPCDPVAVNGWRVTVESGQKRWVYNTDEVGGLVRRMTTRNPL